MQLKLLAMQQQVNARITDSYNAKGVSLETLKKFHNGSGQSIAVQRGAYLSRYTIAFQVLFPIIVAVFLGFLSHHLVENDNTGFLKKVRDIMDHQENSLNNTTDIHSIEKVNVSTRNMHIVILVVCSVTFVVYVLGLDIAAVRNRHVQVTEPIFLNPLAPGFNSTIYGSVEILFTLEYAIPILMLVYDFFIFCAMVTGLVCVRCGLKKKWYHVGIAPVACVVVHSYHIVVGFLHSPHHASGALIFYAIVIFVYFVSMRAAYYNLFHLYVKFNKTDCCKYFLIYICMVLSPNIVLNLLILHRLKCLDVTSCLRSCCTSKYCSKRIPCCSEYKLPHPIILTILSLLSVLMSAVMVFVVILFILVPINLALENAPNRLFGINQTILVFIGAAITYKLYRNQKSKTWFDHVVEANKSYLIDSTTEKEVTKWNNKEKIDKEIEMGKLIIRTLHSQVIQSPAQANQAQLRAIQAQLQASEAQATSVADNSVETIRLQLQAIRAQLQAIRFQANPDQTLQTQLTAIQTQVEVIRTQANPIEAFKTQSHNIQTQLQHIQSLRNPAQTQLQAIKAQLQASQAQADSTQANLVQTKVAQFQAISSQLQAIQDQAMPALAQANPAIQAQLQISQSQLQVIQDQLQSQPNPGPAQAIQAQLKAIRAQLQVVLVQANSTQYLLQATKAQVQAVQAEDNPPQAVGAQLQVIQAQLQAVQAQVYPIQSVKAELQVIKEQLQAFQIPVQPNQDRIQTLLQDIQTILAQLQDIQAQVNPTQAIQ